VNIIKTDLDGVLLLEPKVFQDERGFFMETYNQKTLSYLGIDHVFVQDNHSLSIPAGTLRGLHYQNNPHAQTKLVRVIRGAVYDVTVDIRAGSPAYGKWYGCALTAENMRQLLVPKGFAHGFITLVPDTEVVYKVDDFYAPEHDRAVRWNDPELRIDWPFSNPVLSEKDREAPILKDADNNFTFGEKT
jgi:dTDP-4-dehydrorhamnose 3,5-epimerase